MYSNDWVWSSLLLPPPREGPALTSPLTLGNGAELIGAELWAGRAWRGLA